MNFLLLCVVQLSMLYGFVIGKPTFSEVSLDFSFNFFQTVYKRNPAKNCVVSPIATHRMLVMLYDAGGVTGTPQQQMYEIGRGTSIEYDHNRRNMTNLNNGALEMITKLYHSKVNIDKKLLPVLEAKYSVDVQAMDFSHSEKVVSSVNSWASRFTNGIVTDVFNGNGLSNDVGLVMINTLTLNASWVRPFEPALTRKVNFKFPKGAALVNMMKQDRKFKYCNILDLQVVELPYKKRTDLSMLIIKSDSLPLKRVIGKLTRRTYERINTELKSRDLQVHIPKFSVSMGIEVREALDEMGIYTVFDRDVLDVFLVFSSRLANVYQALSIEIDEMGTQAATGTQSMSAKRMPSTLKFIADGPFVFIIRKQSTKDIIFMGHYSSRKHSK